MNKFTSGIRLPAPEPCTTLKTDILWGSESGGSNHFPKDIETIYARSYSSDPKPLTAFRNAVMKAVVRVWVVDEYFLMPNRGCDPAGRIQTILDWLHPNLEASDIRILTKAHIEIKDSLIDRFYQREQEINALRTRRPKRCSIQVNTRLKQCFDLIHDRFAIVDDELWHFGATVGGFHTSVTAASRGWSAVDSGAIAFFELAWDRCKGK